MRRWALLALSTVVAAAPAAPGPEPSAQVLGSRQTRGGQATLPTTGLAVLGLAWTGFGLVVVVPACGGFGVGRSRHEQARVAIGAPEVVFWLALKGREC